MKFDIRDEIIGNFRKYDSSALDEQMAARAEISKSIAVFGESFLRICTIQSWRANALKGKISEGAEAFFFESQNDFLSSHHLARSGSNRQSLKSLRSAIENVYFCCYYMDHPVELEKWKRGSHRPGFTELHGYLESHPLLQFEVCTQALATLKEEYSTLSKAVHGSAEQFRMTRNLEDVRLWIADPAETGKWSTRQRVVIENINIILIYLFRESISGAANHGLRDVISLVISTKRKSTIKKDLSVAL